MSLEESRLAHAYLQHYGVRGMKWGVRKKSELRPLKDRYNKAIDKAADRADRQFDRNAKRYVKGYDKITAQRKAKKISRREARAKKTALYEELNRASKQNHKRYKADKKKAKRSYDDVRWNKNKRSKKGQMADNLIYGRLHTNMKHLTATQGHSKRGRKFVAALMSTNTQKVEGMNTYLGGNKSTKKRKK